MDGRALLPPPEAEAGVDAAGPFEYHTPLRLVVVGVAAVAAAWAHRRPER